MEVRVVERRLVMMRTRAFSLIEIVLSVCVLALLVGIVSVALTRAAQRARRALDLARLKQHQSVMSVYAAEFRDFLPYFVNPSAVDQFVDTVRSRRTNLGPYFCGCCVWPTALADRYYGGDPTDPMFYSAEDARSSRPMGQPFYYTCTLFAQPAYWELSTREGARQYGGVLASEVTWPSMKIVIVDTNPEFRQLSAPWAPVDRVYAAADGHAACSSTGDALPGVPSGEGLNPGALHQLDMARGLHTVAGVRGRDLR